MRELKLFLVLVLFSLAGSVVLPAAVPGALRPDVFVIFSSLFLLRCQFF